MSLLEKARQECNYELAALVIVYGMLKVIHVVNTFLTATLYKQLLERWNKPSTLKQESGNSPECPANILSGTVSITGF